MTLSGKIEIDKSNWPVVILTMRGEPTESDYKRIFDAGERLMAHGPFIMISDVRELTKVADARQRQEFADWLKLKEGKYGKRVVGSVVVLESRLVRGALTAFLWIVGSERYRIASSMIDAMEIARRMCLENGLSEPDESRRRASG